MTKLCSSEISHDRPLTCHHDDQNCELGEIYRSSLPEADVNYNSPIDTQLFPKPAPQSSLLLAELAELPIAELYIRADHLG